MRQFPKLTFIVGGFDGQDSLHEKQMKYQDIIMMIPSYMDDDDLNDDRRSQSIHG